MADSAEQMERLMAWYQAHHDDEWEHRYGLKLDPLPEGGWLLIIDTGGTAIAGYQSLPQRRESSAEDWIEWHFDPKGFHARGSRRTLGRMIEIFFEELETLAKDER